MAAISLSGIEKTYGALKVVHGLDLEIADGEFVVLVGPSGCGKSTLLRMIAGLEDISGGVLRIGGKIANAVAPAERNVAMVFQDYALYPHMTVAENIGFGLKMRDHPAEETARAVAAAARTLKVAPYLERRPAELSGGQRQRVAMGRAIVRQPEVFLFDEPLSNLDAALRGDMRIEIARLHRSMKATTVYVTHDQVEAMTLADRIVVMNQGRVEQVGSPMELYETPATLFVAQFIGAPMMNAVPAALCPWLKLPGDAATAGFRPEDLIPAPVGSDGFSGEVAVLERLGSQTFGHVDIGAERLLTVEWPKGTALPAVGDPVVLKPGDGRVHAFDATGRRCFT